MRCSTTAGADVIEAAIGITLLLIVSYVVIGSIITAANTVSNTRKDVTLQNEARLNTNILISNMYWWKPYQIPGHYYLHFHVNNTGSESISDFDSIEVFVANSTDYTPKRYPYDPADFGNYPTLGTWAIDSINATWGTPNSDSTHPGMLDPGEIMSINVYFSPSVSLSFPKTTLAGVTTPNGVTAYYYNIT